MHKRRVHNNRVQALQFLIARWNLLLCEAREIKQTSVYTYMLVYPESNSRLLFFAIISMYRLQIGANYYEAILCDILFYAAVRTPPSYSGNPGNWFLYNHQN